jgi:hypothetical protein
MRKPRYLVHDHFGYGVYHVISRVTDRRLVLEDADKWRQDYPDHKEPTGPWVPNFPATR